MIAIHIGLKKAGSSSVQAFLSGNEEALRSLAVDYPKIGRLGRWTHQNLASEIQRRRRFDPGYGTLSQLADYWRGAAGRIMILSSEMFEEAERDEIGHLKDVLVRARGNDAFRIVLIIRELVDLMPSSYAQKIKYGNNTYDFDAFFRERIRERRIDYFATALRWADIFGWQSLRVRLLDRRHLLNGDLLDDFLASCGTGLAAGQIPSAQPPRVSNTSPGWKVIEAIRALYAGRHGLPGTHPLTAALRQLDGKAVGKAAMRAGDTCAWNKDRGRYLTRAQAQACLEAYRTAVEAFNVRLPDKLPPPLDLDARDFAERDFLPDARHIADVELRDFYDELARLLAEDIRAARRKRRRERNARPA